MKHASRHCVRMLLLWSVVAASAMAQITPSDDSYTLTSQPTANFGAKTILEVESAGATTFIRFDLSGIPPTVTGSMVAKATLKIYVSTVTTAGSFNVDFVTSPWKESTITANNSPTLGSAIASAVPVTTADKSQYVLVDVTAAAVEWLNGTTNDGIVIVPDGNASFALNSKETTTTSHPAELDIILTGPAGPPGPISGVTAGAGLAGGGTKGNVTLSLLTSCSSGQVLQWNGSTWACSAAGAGTITGVAAGIDLTGGGTSGKVTLNLDTTKVPQLSTSNTFSEDQSIKGNLTATGAITGQTVNAFFGIFSGSTSYNQPLVEVINSDGDGIYVSSIGGDAFNAITTNGVGVIGQSSSYYGIQGVSGSGTGVYGQTFGNAIGVAGEASNDSGGIGVYGYTQYAGQGVWGESFGNSFFNGAGPDGVHGIANGNSGSGVAGVNTATGGTGVYGAVYDSSSYAGHFDGNVFVNGNLSKNGGSFKIDHPLDPSNQYLYHSFVESPDMKNMYDGVVALGAGGEAVITLPEWFGALNRDFRYQLTCVGGFAPVYVAEEIANNQFKISGGRAGLKVSWQVTGIRQDAWANAHRIPVEELKPEEERGTYLHPELFGAPKEAGLSWRRYRFPDNVQPHKAPVPPAPRNRGTGKPGPTATLAKH